MKGSDDSFLTAELSLEESNEIPVIVLLSELDEDSDSSVVFYKMGISSMLKLKMFKTIFSEAAFKTEYIIKFFVQNINTGRLKVCQNLTLNKGLKYNRCKKLLQG